jgi:hypothetical protein
MKVQVILLLCLCSCKPSKTIFGIYQKFGKDFRYQLELKKDSTFYLSKKNFDVNSSCGGRWYLGNKDTLILKCSNDAIENQIAKEYLRERMQVAIIVSPNTIRVDKLQLLKQKPSH